MPEPKQGPASAAPAAEPLAAILAEMREYFDLLKRGLIPDNVARMTTRQRHQFWADRIEAAVRRERVEREFAHKKVEEALSDEISIRDEKIKRSAPGNASALREALESAHRTLKLVCEHAGEFIQPRLAEEVIHSGAAVERALSAPARNCDRCKFWEDLWGLEFVKLWPDVTDDLQRAWLFVRWLFAPAEGKEAADA